MVLAVHERLGHYEVLGPVGAGGMGEVYRARDTRLDRTVALKILPEGFATDPDRLARFEREAKALAALSHPGILAVHDFGVNDHTAYVVTELLEGQTLRQRLARGALPQRKAVEYAAQIAGGLAAAHDKGIVHRDLKPENLFVTTDGRIKILDFGLAAHTTTRTGAPEPQATEERLTETGAVLGTAGYMSPEQAAGQKADERSDLFSLGCVLHEMLSGKQAFRRDTVAETLTAILREDPPSLSALTPPVPGALERLVQHCVEKRPEDRFQSARDLAFDLQALSGAVASGVGARESGRPVAGLRRWLWAAVTVAALGLAFTLWHRPPAVPRVTAIRQLTHDGTGKELVHTDGTRVYYAALSGTSSRLMQVLVAGGDPVPLETPLRRPYIHDILPSRNELLVEELAVEGDARIWSLSTTGGSPRPLGDFEVFHAAWSADGQSIVYANGRDVLVARSDGSDSRRLVTAPAEVLFPRLSPDGRRLRYTVRQGSPPTYSLWEAAVDGGGAHLLLPGWDAWSGRWTPDGRYYVFSAGRDGESALWARREKGRWPWRDRSASEPTKLTTGPMRYLMPAVSPDGHTLFALGQPPSTGGELVRYDAASGLFVPFLGGLSARDLEFSPDGRWVAYVRHPDGTLWRSHPDGTERRQLTFPPLTAMLPRWSPDGHRIACMSFSPGEKWGSHIVAAEGGKPQPVTDQPGAMDSTWSPDGTSLVFGGLVVDHTPEHPILIQMVDLRSGKVSAVPGSEGLYSPRWSPDGRSIAALSTDNTRLALHEPSTGRWKNLVVGSETLGYPNWMRDSTRIQLRKGRSIVRVRVADGHVEPVTSLERVPLVATEGSWNWIGIAPDDSPLALREMTGPVEVYALDVEWP